MILFLTVAVPLVAEELAHMPDSSAVRWARLGVAAVGGYLVLRGRLGDPAPVRGLFRTKGSR